MAKQIIIAGLQRDSKNNFIGAHHYFLVIKHAAFTFVHHAVAALYIVRLAVNGIARSR